MISLFRGSVSLGCIAPNNGPSGTTPNCPYSNCTPRQQRLLRPEERRLRGAIARGQRSLAAAGAGHQGQRAGLSLPEIGRGSQDAEGIGGSQRVRGGTAGVGGAGAGVREDSKCHDSPKGQGNF
jgi:hypothetical protein